MRKRLPAHTLRMPGVARSKDLSQKARWRPSLRRDAPPSMPSGRAGAEDGDAAGPCEWPGLRRSRGPERWTLARELKWRRGAVCGGATAAVWRVEAGQSRREGRGRGGRPGAGRGREGGRRRKRVRGGDAPGGAEGEVTRGRQAGRAADSRVRLASRGPHARRHPHARPGLE